MSDTSQLDELLLDWQEARARGDRRTPEALAAGSPALLDELRRRIQALEQMESFLEWEPCDPEQTAPAVVSGLSGVPEIPGYEILAELGRGGMGVVYRAVQKSTRRQVALKVLLHGRHASPRQRLRFEREIDLAASLRHPNIVTLYESGTAADGLNYFAMELVPGCSLGEHLATRPPRDELLALFRKICSAVNYAHQRGIMHRDLKPGNIRIDEEGEPHILDFGLAKSAAASDDDDGLTATGEFVGTIAYASPEQAAGAAEQIDLRTDVYALGVILYELLTGALPVPPGPLAAMLRAILEGEPLSPSAQRRLQPGGYPTDEYLDAVVLKALARARQDRYQTAGELAADIENYLAGKPIQARPPGVASLIWAWMRQNVGTAFRIVGIGVVCGSLSAILAGMPRMLPFLSIHWAAEARLAGGNVAPGTVVPPWLLQLLTLGAMLPFAGMGLLLCWLVRPRTRWDDALAGLAAGLVAGLTAFAACGGWGSVVALAVVPVQADLSVLGEPDDAPLLARYPQLADLSAEQRRYLLRDKILGDLVAGIPLGIWLGLALTVGAFAAFGILGAILAGILTRRAGSLRAALPPYLEGTLFATGMVLVVYLQAFFPPRPSAGRTLAMITFAALACLAPWMVVRNWSWPRRAALYVLGFVVIGRLTLPVLPWSVDGIVVALALAALLLERPKSATIETPQ
ncbi:MAG: serine/threonine-protein kinase [Gemmataceae bacterium]